MEKERRTQTTMRDIFRVDDIQSVLSDLHDQRQDIETIAIVVRKTDGNYRLHYYGSVPETIGLMAIAENILLSSMGDINVEGGTNE